MIDNYQVNIDSAIDRAFYAHLLDKIVKFGQIPNRLFRIDLRTKRYKDKNYSIEEYNKLFNNNKY